MDGHAERTLPVLHRLRSGGGPSTLPAARPPLELDTVPSPALVVDSTPRAATCPACSSSAADPSAGAHVKTTKLPELWRLLLEAGVRRFKCATPRGWSTWPALRRGGRRDRRPRGLPARGTDAGPRGGHRGAHPGLASGLWSRTPKGAGPPVAAAVGGPEPRHGPAGRSSTTRSARRDPGSRRRASGGPVLYDGHLHQPDRGARGLGPRSLRPGRHAAERHVGARTGTGARRGTPLSGTLNYEGFSERG